MICDFGTARMLMSSLTLANLTGTSKGTLLFLAPELFEGEMHSEKSDVWAFGMTVYVRIDH